MKKPLLPQITMSNQDIDYWVILALPCFLRPRLQPDLWWAWWRPSRRFER